MSEPINLPAMSEAQEAAWRALMELGKRVPTGWTLIGGQLVHLHCAERGISPSRPTNDVDTVVDVRASQGMLETFTAALKDIGFVPDTTGDGIQHRWRRDLAQFDVLIPEGIGERAAARHGAGGAPTISAPGTTQALARTEIVADRAQGRHCADFVVLANLIAARDFRDVELTKKDRQRLRNMVVKCRQDGSAMAVDNAEEALGSLERAAQLRG